jgi:OstA-like protein
MLSQKYTLSLRWLLTVLLLTVAPWAMAQVGRPPMMGGGQTGPGTEQVTLLGADSLNVLNSPGMSVRRVVNNVRFRHKGALLFCDLAIQNTTSNVIEAYGHVRIVQGDTVTVQGDTMYYYGNTRNATVLNRVILRDRKMTLTTARLDYDMANGLAHYPTKGRIVDKENVLTSEEGYYNTRTKEFTFIRNVRLVNPQTTLIADSLLYNSATKIATFQGPTKIINKDGTLQARDGTYNTTTRVSNFRQRATAFTDKYTLTGDTLNFDNVTELGIAKGNVVMVAKEDKTTITGNQGRYNGKLGITRVTGNATVRTVSAPRDTLFMRADTLFSYDTPSGSKEKKPRKLVGQRNVLVFKNDMQSRCDSLVYTAADSSFYFYKKPIVWSQNYQMEADTITARLKNNKINTLLLRSRSFVVSQDTMKFFNQIKGRAVTAYFKSVLDTLKPKVVRIVRRTKTPTGATVKPAGNAGGKPVPAPTPPTFTTALAGPGTGGKPPKVEEKTQLDKVVVEGNGQSIYFVVDDKNVFTGMNRVDCSKMTIEFTKSRVGNIRFYGRPDGTLTPPKQLTDDKKTLDGFRWRVGEKPSRDNVLGIIPYVPGGKSNLSTPPLSSNIPANLPVSPAAVNQATTLIKSAVETVKAGNSLPLDKNGIKLEGNNKPLATKPSQKQ